MQTSSFKLPTVKKKEKETFSFHINNVEYVCIHYKTKQNKSKTNKQTKQNKTFNHDY